MIKFILTIWVCSFLAGTKCMAPVTYPDIYDSWLECSKAAHLKSVKLLENFDPDFVNMYEVGMKYNCNHEITY